MPSAARRRARRARESAEPRCCSRAAAGERERGRAAGPPPLCPALPGERMAALPLRPRVLRGPRQERLGPSGGSGVGRDAGAAPGRWERGPSLPAGRWRAAALAGGGGGGRAALTLLSVSCGGGGHVAAGPGPARGLRRARAGGRRSVSLLSALDGVRGCGSLARAPLGAAPALSTWSRGRSAVPSPCPAPLRGRLGGRSSGALRALQGGAAAARVSAWGSGIPSPGTYNCLDFRQSKNYRFIMVALFPESVLRFSCRSSCAKP